MLDKTFILSALSEQVEYLRRKYTVFKDKDNTVYTKHTTACYRSRYKQQMELCTLLFELIKHVPDGTILTTDAIRALERITDDI